MLDGAWRQPERDELAMRDDSVLPLCELGNGSIEGDLQGAWAEGCGTNARGWRSVCHRTATRSPLR